MVVDASFLAAAIFEEDHTRFARDIIAKHPDGFTAPALLTWELSNIVWKKCRRGLIDAADIPDFISIYATFDVALARLPDLDELGELTATAVKRDLTAYDAAYFQFAVMQGFPLATTDRGLSKTARAAGVVVHSPFA
ncbi:MAG TPA: type II toxin-antitoxin system VapC family toxin [Brevundimonas sp.]|jgi:predicted nucleic acid-binding protein